jgi:hypothetical protein
MIYFKTFLIAAVVSSLSMLINCNRGAVSSSTKSAVSVTSMGSPIELVSYDCMSNFKYLDEVYLVRESVNKVSGKVSRLEVLSSFSSVESCQSAMKSGALISETPEKISTSVSKECYFSRIKEDDKRGFLVYEIKDSHSDKVLDLAFLSEQLTVTNCEIWMD